MSRKARERVLVTGGAGYVGSHTAARLLECGYDVDVIDDLSTGHEAAVPRGAELICGTLHDLDLLRRILKAGQYEAVFHFAALSLVGESMRQPFRYLGTNLTAALNLLEAMAESGVTRLVLSSTANLFAEESGPINEEAPINPGSPYGESKLAIERALVWAERIHGIRHACLRYFNAAGADPRGGRGEDHDPETHLIPLVLQVALGQRERIEVFGSDYPTPDGSCIRDYVHVCDLADAHVLAMRALDRGSRRYNLGTGTGHSVREVIAMARAVTGRDIPANAADRRPGDPPCLVADPGLVGRDIGWVPRYGLQGIIETAWAWHRANPRGYGDAVKARVASR